MSTNSTGQNQTQANHTLSEIIAGGVTIHLVDTAMGYTDGATAVSNNSVVSKNVAEADLTVTTPSGYSGTATIDAGVDIVIDVSGNTATVVEGVMQNQSNTGRFVLMDETNDPDLSQIDDYKISTGDTLYELGNP